MKALTKSTKPISEKTIKRNWHLFDASDKILGRIATEISMKLQGKDKVTYAPYLDCGDYVVVINAQKVKVSGSKGENKIYTKYSGYPGGLKSASFDEMIDRRPHVVIQHAVSGMLPKNKLRDRRMARLFVYPDDNNPYKDKFVTKDGKKD